MIPELVFTISGIPNTDTKMLLHKLRIELRTQPPPRITLNPASSSPVMALSQ